MALTKLTTKSITGDTLEAGDLAANSVDSSELVDGSIDTSHLSDDSVTLAKMASGTDGNIISYDSSGNPVAIATGTSGHFLKSQGAGNQPVFAAAGGGKVLASYAVQGYGDVSSGSSTSWVQVQNQTVTPASASSKFLLMLSHTPHTNDTGSVNNQGGRNGFRRAISGGATTDFPGNSWYAHDVDVVANFPSSFQYLDSPNTTSNITYSSQYMRSDDDGYTFYQHNQLGSSTSLMTFIILEISS